MQRTWRSHRPAHQPSALIRADFLAEPLCVFHHCGKSVSCAEKHRRLNFSSVSLEENVGPKHPDLVKPTQVLPQAQAPTSLKVRLKVANF